MTQILLSPRPSILGRRPRVAAPTAAPGPEVEAILRDLALVLRLTEQVKAAIRSGK